MQSDKIIIQVKRLHPAAELPKRQHDDDSGFDVKAIGWKEIAPYVYSYSTGIAIKPPAGIDVQGRPRSSVFYKTGMVLSNSVGTIDSGYRGEVGAVFYHLLPQYPQYDVGDRIFQLVVGNVPDLRLVEFVEVEEFDDEDKTTRGAGGFGSTGA